MFFFRQWSRMERATWTSALSIWNRKRTYTHREKQRQGVTVELITMCVQMSVLSIWNRKRTYTEIESACVCV